MTGIGDVIDLALARRRGDHHDEGTPPMDYRENLPPLAPGDVPPFVAALLRDAARHVHDALADQAPADPQNPLVTAYRGGALDVAKFLEEWADNIEAGEVPDDRRG